MPDILIGTNTGPSAYGPPTGKRVRYSGTAVCYVQKVKGRWVYVSEWLLHDEWALISQLGLSNLTQIPHPPLDDHLHDCTANTPGFGWTPPADVSNISMQEDMESSLVKVLGEQGEDEGNAVPVSVPPVEPDDPAAKAVVKRMDEIIADHVQVCPTLTVHVNSACS